MSIEGDPLQENLQHETISASFEDLFARIDSWMVNANGDKFLQLMVN